MEKFYNIKYKNTEDKLIESEILENQALSLLNQLLELLLEEEDKKQLAEIFSTIN